MYVTNAVNTVHQNDDWKSETCKAPPSLSSWVVASSLTSLNGLLCHEKSFLSGASAKAIRKKRMKKAAASAAALPPPPAKPLTRKEREIESLAAAMERLNIRHRTRAAMTNFETMLRSSRKERRDAAKERREKKDRGEELYPGQLWIDQQRRSMRIAQEIEAGERYDQATDSEPELSEEEEVMTESDDDENDHVYDTLAMPGPGYAKFGLGGGVREAGWRR
ncbi:hypothetical protein BKA64DRAFT_774001 [Cadophora sp. MPI-SDFR-AT-0126]|nr:hypothetical protein BKA64DRAFT_774001 [Leotiomycetes sp. MPI-SDFR-AT-0126]